MLRLLILEGLATMFITYWATSVGLISSFKLQITQKSCFSYVVYY